MVDLRYWRAAQDLRDVKLLDQLGWTISLTAWRATTMLAALAAAIAVAVGSFIAVVFFGTSTGQDPGRQVMIGATLIDLYLTLIAVLRLRFGADGTALVHHPHAAFLRALDIPRHTVIASGVGRRIVFVAALEACMSLGALAGEHALGTDAPSANVLALLLAPTASASVMLATTAVVSVGRRPLGRRMAVGGLCAVVVAALAAGAVIGQVVAGTAWDRIASLPDPAGLSVAVVTVETSLSAIASFILITSIRRLRSVSWPGVSETEAEAPKPDRRARGSLVRTWPLVSGIPLGQARRPLGRTLGLAWIISAAVIGFAIAGPSLIPGVSTAIGRAAVALAFVVGLLISDLLLRFVGPISLSGQLRFAYEQGASPWALAGQLVAAQVSAALVVLAPGCLALQLLGVSWLPLIAISTTCIGAGALAAALSSAARRNERGESSGSPAAVIVAVALSGVAVAVALLVPEPFRSPVLIAVVAAVLGGALSCVRSRIVRRPFTVENS